MPGTTDPAPTYGATTDAVKHSPTTDAVKHSATTDAVKHDSGTYGPRFTLAEAEAQRMAQLSAEVTARLDEMAQIFASTTGFALDGMSPRYVPEPPQAARADVTYVEIVCGPEGCGCYVTLSDGTSWCEFPCGG
jgi:hypothetical protein